MVEALFQPSTITTHVHAMLPAALYHQSHWPYCLYWPALYVHGKGQA
jgi:hypothetical protein